MCVDICRVFFRHDRNVLIISDEQVLRVSFCPSFCKGAHMFPESVGFISHVLPPWRRSFAALLLMGKMSRSDQTDLTVASALPYL